MQDGINRLNYFYEVPKFFILFFIFGLKPVWSTEIKEFYRGVRPMGMGNAFTALANDEDSVFYNPAGIAYNKSIKLNISNIKYCI